MLALQKKYMKIFYALKIFVILLGLSISVEAMSQSKKELKNENYSLKIALQKSNDTIQQMKNSIDLLNQEIVSLKNKLSILNSKSVSNELNTNIEDKDKSDIEKNDVKLIHLKELNVLGMLNLIVIIVGSISPSLIVIKILLIENLIKLYIQGHEVENIILIVMGRKFT